MIPLRSLLPASLATMMMLPACAGSVSSYPSLAPRAIEQGEAAPAPAPALARLDPAVLARAAALGEQARYGDDAFATAVRSGCGAIDRGLGATEGGEAWVAAQQALSAVEAAREPTTRALNELDGLVLDQARQAQDSVSPIDLSPLTDAARAAEALDTAQAARLNDLRSRGCRA